ncbi:MAG: methyltransferase domain-containing protein [Bacteroidota bacterium]
MNYKKNGSRVKVNDKTIEKSFGPVDNPEKYLQADWWRRIFNSMYLKTDADVVDDKEITRGEVDLFMEILQPSQDSYMLDIACGQGRHTQEFAQRGIKNIFGLDRSHYLIRKAKSTSNELGLNITYKEGDARKLPFNNDTFDYITILGNSFGYFETVEDDVKILKEIIRVLKPYGRFLIDVSDGDYLKENFSPRGWEWMDKNHFVCRERSLSKDKDRLISREVITNIHKGVVIDQFYAERLYSRENLRSILGDAGFKNISFHNEINTASNRNQDLGMMQKRIIVTAQVIKEWTPSKIICSPGSRKNVVVLLGDPTKNDIVKPQSIFDEDDFHTIKQLKIALSELPDYKFVFLDNHNTFFKDLQRLKPKTDFVFNLCDEGFGNDANKELLVPALLEILEIPYTGSNPRCLAYCYDKSLIRGISKEMQIPVAEAFFIKPEDNVFELNIDFPVIAKPNFGDSSFGITQESVAYNIEELNNAILKTREKFGYDKPVLVEEFLTGAEITVGIIGNAPESYTMLPIIEEDYFGITS